MKGKDDMVRKLDAGDIPADQTKGVAVVAFSAAWCPPCKVMAPIYEEAAAKFTSINFLKANQEETPELFDRYGVSAIPTYVVLKDGEVVHRQVGALPASRFHSMLEAFA